LKGKLLEYIGGLKLEITESCLKKLYFDFNLSPKMIGVLFDLPQTQILKIVKQFEKKTKEQIIESQCVTNLVKYGNRSSLHGGIGKEKKLKTWKYKYGTDSPNSSEVVKEKKRQAYTEKYGVDNPAKNPEVRQKMYATSKERHGFTVFSQKHVKNIDDRNPEYWKENFVKDGYFLIDSVKEHHGYKDCMIRRIKNEFKIKEPVKQSWKTQREVYDYVCNLTDKEIFFNDRKTLHPLELDIHIPGLKLAIELNGVMFHSYGRHKSARFDNLEEEDRNNLLKKTLLCEEKDIRLLHVWDIEWKNQREFVKGLIFDVVNNFEVFDGENLELDRRFCPLEIPGYVKKVSSGPRRYDWKGRSYFDCGTVIFNKEKTC
jgi:hypothetical protein